jgi:hypothetical protein
VIFLSSPYTDVDPVVVARRVAAARAVATGMMNENPDELVFSLIVYAHDMTTLGLPNTYEFWDAVVREMIQKSRLVVVITSIPGWETSPGVKNEIQIANQLGVPVEYRTVVP